MMNFSRIKNNLSLVLLVGVFTVSLIPVALSYHPVVHQHMANESRESWNLIPIDFKSYFIQDASLNNDYNFGDDIMTGVFEEDSLESTLVHHFWEPDDPDTLSSGIDDYDDGVTIFGSSYRRALDLWRSEVIPSYLRGDIDRSYYYLGRVAHLLEDAAQPSHVLLDPHPISSILEDYTGNISIYQNYDGIPYNGLEYKYENLIDGFNWSQVQPTRNPDKFHPELFRLFWYTAQKTQYWASDDIDGNKIYLNLSGATRSWECGTSNSLNLWKNESYSCSYFINESNDLNSTTVEREANANLYKKGGLEY